MKPIPGKVELRADLHKLKVMILDKQSSNIERLFKRYLHILNKMIASFPRKRDGFQIDEVASEILKKNHSDKAESLSPIRY